MPFQISTSSSKSEIPTVLLKTAGTNQTIICAGTTIFLEAKVDDTLNLVGHSLLWEQLNGGTVVLTAPNQITTTFNLDPLDKTDKLFRFWIDKGTANQQYADVEIWQTPTSLLAGNSIGSKSTFGPPVDQATSVTGIAVVITPPFNGTHDANVNAVTGVQLDWVEPFTDDLGGKHLYTEVLLDGVVIDTVYSGDFARSINNVGVYTLRSHFEVPPYIPPYDYLTYDVVFDASTVEIDGIYWVVDDVTGQGIGLTSSIERYRNSIFRVPLPSSYATGGTSSHPINVTRINNKIFYTEPPSVYTTGGIGSTPINITRIDTSGIGGSIGGS